MRNVGRPLSRTCGIDGICGSDGIDRGTVTDGVLLAVFAKPQTH